MRLRMPFLSMRLTPRVVRVDRELRDSLARFVKQALVK